MFALLALPAVFVLPNGCLKHKEKLLCEPLTAAADWISLQGVLSAEGILHLNMNHHRRQMW